MPSLPHRPALAPRDGTSSFASLHNSDVYYSNEEIAVLYDVVAAAQGNLSHLPEGERLATNALFQAYDMVLPLHDIDPEEDHHISRLVFRVGGERGDGSLMDKLRAVLSRMGIEIEFETHSGSPKPQFFQVYEGAQASPSESFSSLPGVEPKLHVAEGLFKDASKGHLRGHLHMASPTAAPAHMSQPPSHFRLTDALPAPDHPSSALREYRRPLSQSSTHSVASDYKQRRSNSWSPTESVEQRIVSDTTVQPANSAPLGPKSDTGDSISYPKNLESIRCVNWVLPGTANESLFDGRGGYHEQHHGRSVQPTREINVDREQVGACEESPPSLPVKNRPPGEDYSPGQSYVDEENQHQPAVLGNIDSARNSVSRKIQNLPAADPRMESQYALLEMRASKAARYLQLLRGVSHWRACAIEKLERTAVARRHILRMRYFDPWELITADAKVKGRRLFMSCLLSLWSEQADDTDFGGRTALAKARQSSLTRPLTAWSQLYSAQPYSKRPRGSVTLHLQQWQTACFIFHTLQTRADVLFRMFVVAQLSSVWRKELRISQGDISTFKQCHLIRRSLVQWHLETKVEVFRARIGSRLVCEALYRWHSACLAPLTLDDFENRILAGDPTRLKLHRLPRAFMSRMIIMRMLRTKVLEQWQCRTIASANNMKRSSRRADHYSAQSALGTWHDNVQHGLGLFTWAQRGRFYVSVTSSLKFWRAKATWSSNTRKSYAQCRQRVKITLTKGYMFRWKALVRSRADIGRESAEHHGIVKQARLGLMLAAWREESNSDLRVTISLMVALLQEWHNLSVVDASEQQRAADMWDEMLKTRYWGQWQSTLLQLKSREYVASDVKERNEKKLVRRVLLTWKGDGREVDSQLSSAMRMSLTTSRRRMSLGANRNSLQLSKAFRERIAPPLRLSGQQDFGLVAEEEDGPGSGGDVDRVVVNTPTRWTGMASSVTRLPSMTPFAPLPTPFERELREKYNRSTAAVSQSRPDRLSFAQTQRTSVKEASRRQVADNTV